MRGTEFDFAAPGQGRDVRGEDRNSLRSTWRRPPQRCRRSRSGGDQGFFETISSKSAGSKALASRLSRAMSGDSGLRERAYRRPLSKAERDGVAAFCQSLRDRDGLTRGGRPRRTASVLMSPRFCYRVDRAEGQG